MILIYNAVAVLIGFALDILFGDPHTPLHPICLIGRFISFGEKHIRRHFPKTERGEYTGGAVLSILTVFAVYIICAAVCIAAYKIHFGAYIGVSGIMCWLAIAACSLHKESMKVKKSLDKGDVEEARYNVSMIVGRDTAALDESGIIRAAVETVAENTSDGVIAPLFYYMLGGAPLAFAYKAVNTLDSMIGYKNDKYMHFGRFAAHLDDAVNFIPARLSAVLMIISSAMWHMDVRGAVRIYRRDRLKHASPNSAQTEAVCAGALGVRLAGDAYYFGKLHKKPYIGDNKRDIHAYDIQRANLLMYTSSSIMVICAAGINAVLGGAL